MKNHLVWTVALGPESERLESDETFRGFRESPYWAHFVGMVQLPGVRECFTALETHYLGPRNAYLQLRLARWHGLDWAVASIPTCETHLMRWCARAFNLYVTDINVVVLVGWGQDSTDTHFPISGKNVYHLLTGADRASDKTISELFKGPRADD